MGTKSAIGIGNGICFKQVRDKGGGSYIDPLVRDSLVGLWKFDQNTNESPTRNIIKNTIKDKGGDLELLNFGYKLNSGYGGYIEDFSLFTVSNRFEYSEISNTKVTITAVLNNSTGIYHSVTEKDSALYWNTFKIKVSGSTDDVYIIYSTINKRIRLYNGINTVVVPNELSWHSFATNTIYASCNITLEFVPEYEGALVTDGKDDMIVSQKTVQEMGITDEITVVSMIHQIGIRSEYNRAFNNYIRNQDVGFIRNNIAGVGIDKTGIYGYTWNNSTKSVINNILGDKNDYSIEAGVSVSIEGKFTVEGYINNGSPDEISEVAVYWTFIANKVLTTDEINQIIGYFKLDKYVTPQVIYDVKRQGLTNDTPEADWYLKDFSGNGHDMTLYNFAKKLGSGIGKYEADVEQIPDYEGALVSDGIDDYGKAEGLPILKDYTVAADYARLAKNISSVGDSPILSKSMAAGNGAFIMNSIDNSGITACYSFGTGNSITLEDIQRKIYYQSKYSNQGKGINAGSIEDGTSMWLDTIRDNDTRFIESAFYSMLLFPYSLSEFLLERQLKRYKLGTLYPDMVEFRPVISGNIPYNAIEISQGSTVLYNKSINKTGIYLQEGSTVRVYIQPSGIDEVSKITINEVEYTDLPINPNGYCYADFPITKSPQKISYAIDEYIRYEDIVQPYPAIINLKQDGKTITWGDKLKVGSDIVFAGSANLLPELYTVSETRYNGVTLYPNTIIKVEKSMVFDNARTYLKANEPNCILSPNRLRIPNSSYKILGYIPDLTGNGNHGRLNNFAYTEESGANEDGSIRFDGVDDYIIIPTIKHGGKALLMKVNWRYKNNIAMVYDQRIKWVGFGISISKDQLPSVAYKPYNKVTYIDGIKNESVLVQDLEGITHNITGIYDNLNLSDERDVCISRTSDASNSGFADMSMYEFMLFPDVPNEEEIKELNDIVGIEGGYVESPNYYWDAYGKKNTDTDRNLIADQVSKDVANALEVKNVAYNSESGYTDDNGLLLDGVEDHAVNTVIPAVTDFTVIGKRNILNHESGFAIKGGDTTSTAAFILEYGSDKFYNFGGVDTVEYPDTITVATKSSYNNNPAVSSQGIDSLGLRIGEYRNYYSKLVFYKLMLYTKTIDQLSINMLKNMFERDELIDVTNPIFKKKEL